jgi:hypothetical protein
MWMRMISGYEAVREVMKVARDELIDWVMRVERGLLLQRLQLDHSKIAPGASPHSRHNVEAG